MINDSPSEENGKLVKDEIQLGGVSFAVLCGRGGTASSVVGMPKDEMEGCWMDGSQLRFATLCSHAHSPLRATSSTLPSHPSHTSHPPTSV